MNQEEVNKIKSFTDLAAWQEGHKLTLIIYRITKTFPQEEMFCLVNQMRRAAVSVTSNIAEGFSRPSYKDKVKFYYMSLGSVTELQNQLVVSRDVGYIENIIFQDVSGQTIKVSKVINGLIKKSKSFIPNS